MKRIILSGLLVLSFHTASSQVLIALLFGKKLNSDKLEFGLMASPMLSDLTNVGGNPKPGLGIGLYFRLKINDKLVFRPELSPQTVFGAKKIAPYTTGDSSIDSIYTREGSEVQRNIKAFSMPLMMQYRLFSSLFVQGGIQADLRIQAKDIFKAKVNGNPVDYTIGIKEKIAAFDMGVSAGLEYKLKKDKGVGLGLRYYYGLTDVQKDLTDRQSNTAWYINVSIPIGIGSQKQEL